MQDTKKAAEVPISHRSDSVMIPVSIFENRTVSVLEVLVKYLIEKQINLIDRKCAKLNVPYQTILSSLIHQYVTEKVKPTF